MCDLETIDVDPVGRWRRGMQALSQPEQIRVWQRDSFRLELSDTPQTDRQGKSRLAYRFSDSRMEGSPIFQGQDFCGSPLHADDSDATVAALLSFLSLQPGDTDAEYFEEYSRRQTEWMELHAEELACLCSEMEEAFSQAREQDGSDALYIDLADDGTLDTVISVFDVMTGQSREERFSDVDRDADGTITAAGWADIREQVESDNFEHREECFS